MSNEHNEAPAVVQALAFLDGLAGPFNLLDMRPEAERVADLLRLEHCAACGRMSEDCSADPCPAVIAARGEDLDEATRGAALLAGRPGALAEAARETAALNGAEGPCDLCGAPGTGWTPCGACHGLGTGAPWIAKGLPCEQAADLSPVLDLLDPSGRWFVSFVEEAGGLEATGFIGPFASEGDAARGAARMSGRFPHWSPDTVEQRDTPPGGLRVHDNTPAGEAR